MISCSFNDCEKQHSARGYCDAHYRQLRLGKVLKPLRNRGKSCVGESCIVHACDGDAITRGLCSRHYMRLLRHGDTGVNYNRKRNRSQKTLSIQSLDFRLTHNEHAAVKDLLGSDFCGASDY